MLKFCSSGDGQKVDLINLPFPCVCVFVRVCLHVMLFFSQYIAALSVFALNKRYKHTQYTHKFTNLLSIIIGEVVIGRRNDAHND